MNKYHFADIFRIGYIDRGGKKNVPVRESEAPLPTMETCQLVKNTLLPFVSCPMRLSSDTTNTQIYITTRAIAGRSGSSPLYNVIGLAGNKPVMVSFLDRF